MRTPRIYCPQPLRAGERATLVDEAANHVARVLRLREGAPLVLFDGTGGEFEASVAAVARREVVVAVHGHRARECESPLAITLVQAVSRGERMDYTIQKAVELGVTRIVPVLSTRSVVSLDEERRGRRMEHWRKIIIGACEQCGRNRLPELLDVRPLDAWLRHAPDGLGLVLDHRAEHTLGELAASQAVTLLIGPEGGLAAEEVAAARAAGYRGLRLGPRVLRTETAAVTALSVLQARWGDLG
ncbi:MAG: 16S rRNA (uracil(1498)-N(3))-methyltransferase [Thiohalomonadaceae bacterium]